MEQKTENIGYICEIHHTHTYTKLFMIGGLWIYSIVVINVVVFFCANKRLKPNNNNIKIV